MKCILLIKIIDIFEFKKIMCNLKYINAILSYFLISITWALSRKSVGHMLIGAGNTLI